MVSEITPATASFLAARLRELGVENLDLILLTHVHLDHAGGTAAVLAEFSTAADEECRFSVWAYAR